MTSTVFIVDQFLVLPSGTIELVNLAKSRFDEKVILRVDPRKPGYLTTYRPNDPCSAAVMIEHLGKQEVRFRSAEDKSEFARIAYLVGCSPIDAETYLVTSYTVDSAGVSVNYRRRGYGFDHVTLSDPLYCWSRGEVVVFRRKGKNRKGQTKDVYLITKSQQNAKMLADSVNTKKDKRKERLDATTHNPMAEFTGFPWIPKDRGEPGDGMTSLADCKRKFQVDVSVTTRPEDRLWTTIDKVQVRLGEMEDRHLLNCLEGKFGSAEIRLAMEQVLRNRATLLRSRADHLEVDLDTALGKTKKVVKP